MQRLVQMSTLDVSVVCRNTNCKHYILMPGAAYSGEKYAL